MNICPGETVTVTHVPILNNHPECHHNCHTIRIYDLSISFHHRCEETIVEMIITCHDDRTSVESREFNLYYTLLSISSDGINRSYISNFTPLREVDKDNMGRYIHRVHIGCLSDIRRVIVSIR